jgi:hypothetical protein
MNPGDTKKSVVIPAKAGIHLDLGFLIQSKMDYAPLLRRALRASFAVRFGILPPQSRFRGNDGYMEFVHVVAMFSPDHYNARSARWLGFPCR